MGLESTYRVSEIIGTTNNWEIGKFGKKKFGKSSKIFPISPKITRKN
jgi:hypothetical protein